MDNKIKELEKQCWSYYVDGVLIDGQLHFDTKKFAELIVKECADHIMNSTDRYRKEYFANMIKEHFGVEE